MRALTQAADVNIAAISYHFGGKEGLLEAVAGLAIDAVNTERAKALDALLAQGSPTVGDLVDAFVGYGLGLGRDQPGGEAVSRFVGRVVFDPQPIMRKHFAHHVSSVEGRYLRAIQDAAPHLDGDESEFRFRAMIALLATYQAGSLKDLSPDPRAVPVSREREEQLLRRCARQLFAASGDA